MTLCAMKMTSCEMKMTFGKAGFISPFSFPLPKWVRTHFVKVILGSTSGATHFISILEWIHFHCDISIFISQNEYELILRLSFWVHRPAGLISFSFWNESTFILTFSFSFCKMNPDSFCKSHFVCSAGRTHFIFIVKMTFRRPTHFHFAESHFHSGNDFLQNGNESAGSIFILQKLIFILWKVIFRMEMNWSPPPRP